MKNNVFLKGTLVLIVCNLIGKILGAVYRIPLAGIIGSEGMGQYQLTFPLYCLILTISTSGIPVAISKMVAEFNSNKDFLNSKKLLKTSIVILTIISALSAILLSLLAKTISKWQGNPEIYICYYAITPAILFVGLLSAFRGYFQGNLFVYPTAFSGLIEQVVKLFAGLFLAQKFLVYGTEFAVFGAIIGISISELVACLFLIICYVVHLKKFANKSQNGQLYSSRELSKKLLSVAVPITFGGLIAPITNMVDSLLVVNLLMIDGFSSVTATMMLGLQSGVVEPLVNIPVVIAVSISTVLLPSISNLVVKKDMTEIKNIILKAFEICLSIAATCFVCFIVFGKQILTFLYGSTFGLYELSIALKLLFVGGFNILFLSLVQISSGVLQGLSHHKYPVVSLIIGCLIKIALDIALILVPSINILGTVLSAGVCYLVVFSLNYRKIKKITGIKISKLYGKIAFQQAAISVCAYFLNNILLRFLSGSFSMFLAGGITGIVFLLTFYFMSVYKKNQNFKQAKI